MGLLEAPKTSTCKLDRPFKYERNFSYSVRIVRWYDEVRLDVVLPQVGVSLATSALLHLVVVAQTLERLLGDVDAPERLVLH